MIDPDSLPRLDQYDSDEWFEVARAVNPRITRAEFDEQWVEFRLLKEEGIFDTLHN